MNQNNSTLVNRPATAVTQAQPIASGLTFVPRVDVFETGDELTLVCDLPGVKPADLDLAFENNELTLEGRVQPRLMNGRPYCNEYGVGDFHRTFTIRTEVEPDKIAAELKNGVLTVRMPKKDAIKPRKIQVAAS